MATATAAPEELTATIDQRIIAATAKVRNIEQRIAEAAEELAGLRTEYSERARGLQAVRMALAMMSNAIARRC